MKVITVTWMDGSQETYHCEEATVGDDAVLRLRQPRGSREPYRAIPLANVRIWVVEP